MNLPYGTADFASLRRGDYFYVDKTVFIPRLEDARLGRKHLLFLRPRRFGKSTLLSMLEHYYDIERAGSFTELFTGLHVDEHPTPERSRYLILRLDFAGMTTDLGAETLRRSFTQQLRSQLDAFFAAYQRLLPEPAALWGSVPRDGMDPADLMTAFTKLVQRGPHPVYLLIDEHDNFANDLVARGREDVYREVLHASGFVREFYKRLKTAADTGVIARMFITGVSPIMVNDMTSGFNILKSISQHQDFHELCGFQQVDVERVLDGVMGDRGLRLDRAQVLADLRRYYDGYRFSPWGEQALYNPDMVLHFLSELTPPDRYPDHLLDMNVRTDYSKLHRLLFEAGGAPRSRPIALIEQLMAEGSIVAPVHDLFRLEEAYDEKYFASYLYYLGLVTLGEQEENLWRLRVPNLAIRQTYGEALNQILRTVTGVQVGEDMLGQAVGAMAFRGEVGPFCDLLYRQVIRHLSNRDLIRMDERGLKVLVLGYLGLTDVFHPFTELETGQGYSDLVLALNRRYPQARYSYVVELKYVKETREGGAAGGGKKGPAGKGRGAGRRRKTAAELRREVEARFAEGEAQLRAYCADPRLDAIRGPGGWKAVTLVQVGTSALYHRELGQPTQQAQAV